MQHISRLETFETCTQSLLFDDFQLERDFPNAPTKYQSVNCQIRFTPLLVFRDVKRLPCFVIDEEIFRDL